MKVIYKKHPNAPKDHPDLKNGMELEFFRFAQPHGYAVVAGPLGSAADGINRTFYAVHPENLEFPSKKRRNNL